MKKKARLPFFNRELSWIEFNARVLGEALDAELPLLDRLKFLSIVGSNFDEFFMVRVASLKRQLKGGAFAADPAGMSPQAQLEAIGERVRAICREQYRCLREELIPALADKGLALTFPGGWDGEQQEYLRERFEREIYPILTPVRVDAARPFASLGNLRLHAAFLIKPLPNTVAGDDLPADEERLAIVQLPPSFERFIKLPSRRGTAVFAFLENVITSFPERLFPGFEVIEHCVFRLTRDADFGVDEERDDDFVEAMAEVLSSRQMSEPVRLTMVEAGPRLRRLILSITGMDERDLYELPGPLDLKCLMEIALLPGFDQLREEPWRPLHRAELEDEDEPLWPVLAGRDFLLHHPYESYNPITRLVALAADDPDVLAIKMTLYRTSGDSSIVEALQRAAENGKQVGVVVELKARFDESQNIEWAGRLERAGVIVVYGLARLKVHAKALLVIRREEAGIRRYVHLGTGNYNDRTARLYTDYSLLSAREDLGYEVGLVFNALTGYSGIPNLRKLAMAPATLKARVIQLIEREASRGTPENPGLIMAKMNALTDPDVIRALYEASQVGVRILLNVRGICMLVPGLAGLSESISVVSIVDRFLEHGRLYYFNNNGAEEIFCSSADWMTRNLENRVELMFPVEQRELKQRLVRNLKDYFRDNLKSHALQSDGSWRRNAPAGGAEGLRVQRLFYEEAAGAAETGNPVNRKEFTVRRKPPASKRK